MRYPIDFLMKHNIAFSCPWFFAITLTQTNTYTHTHRGKKINIIQYALQSQTPSNLSALDFKVWVFAYFVLDCCHFVTFVCVCVFFFLTTERNGKDCVQHNFLHRIVTVQHLVLRAADKSAVLIRQVCWRSYPVIQLITVSGSGSFERSSVANLPLISLMPITSPRHKNISNYLNFSPC